MFSNSNRFRLLLVLSFCQIAVFGVQADTGNKSVQQVENVYECLAGMHLPTLAKEELKENGKSAQVEEYNQELKKKWFNVGGTVKIPALGDVEKLRQAYLIFGAQNTADAKNTVDTNEVQKTTVSAPVVNEVQNAEANKDACAQHLDRTTLEDLEVFSGQKSKLQRHVLALFEPYLHTAIGKVQLQKMLFEPLTNLEELQQRQNKIKQLFNDITKLEQLNEKLQGLMHTENEVLWFWKNVGKSTFDQLEQSAVSPLFPLPKTAMNGIEKIPSATEALSKGSLAVKGLMNPATWPALAFGACLYKYGWNACSTFLANVPSLVKDNYQSIVDSRGTIAFYGAYFLLLSSILTYQNVKAFADYNSATNSIHAKMNNVAQFMEIAYEVLGADVLARDSKDVESLVNLLNTSTFKSEPSFFSYKGRVVSAFTLMNELKNHFVSMLEQLGQLDAQVAVASFMRDQQNNKNGKYCFPDYIQANAPYLKLNQYWHPFLNQETVVTNDIELGVNVNRNIIVTGPNAGGKSTAVKSIALALIMAQTLGIAPAQAVKVTPFKNIVTYMNIADDAGFESLFQAEMHRVLNLIEMIKNQMPGDFIFVVMDELFTGTNPLEGKSAAYGVIKKLMSYNNSTLIFVTHFKELTELEKETNGMIKNFKVSVNESGSTETGKHISYTYKLVPGISEQTIALDLLAQEGFDSEILKDSYAMLNRLKKSIKTN